MRAFAESSYRADVAFCVMTLLAALLVACDTGGIASSATSDRSDDPSPQALVVDSHPTTAPTASLLSDGAVTRR